MLESLTSEKVVTRSLLLLAADTHPDRHLVEFEDGSTWTYRQALLEASAAANALRASGLNQDDCVAVILPNGPDFLRTWFGAALLGAVLLPINPALRGPLLERPLRLADPTVIVVDPGHSAILNDVQIPSHTAVLEPAILHGSDTKVPEIDHAIELWDTEKYLMTSGTTGPSKLVRIPYLHAFWGYGTILQSQNFGPDDVFQIDLPLFHSAAMGYVNATLANGSAMYVRSRPALDSYWEIARDARVSGAILISSMVPTMMGYPPRAAEREHRMRFMITAPIPPDIPSFRERFGVSTLLTSFGSTEASTPIRGEAVPGIDPSYCGETMPGWEVRLVDAHDQEVPVGQVGEAIIRCNRPFVMSPGYVDDPVATAGAWGNAWFHTGDLLRQDSRGRFYFVDRTKDVIRRRGENISAYEVELAIANHQSVAEVACVPVPADSAVEDEVKAWIVIREGSDTAYADLLEHAYAALPHHMVPRYYEFTAAIPKTPTGKPQKYILRDRGNSADTWDSHAHGFKVTRWGIERTATRL